MFLFLKCAKGNKLAFGIYEKGYRYVQ
jgi:hypothetical protein